MKFDDQVQFLDYMRQPGAMPMIINDEALKRSAEPGPWKRRRMAGLYF
jgi:hypothetical protein